MIKDCPVCSGPMVSLMSQNERLCVDYLYKEDNKLREGQQTLIKAQR